MKLNSAWISYSRWFTIQHTSYKEEVETGISRLGKDNITPFSSRINFNSETII